MKKRSNAPIFWSLFGAGGMLSALIGPALVFVTGIAVPLGFLLGTDAMSYPRMLHFAGNWAGKAFVFAVIALFLWHAAHRIFHSLHDLGHSHRAAGHRTLLRRGVRRHRDCVRGAGHALTLTGPGSGGNVPGTGRSAACTCFDPAQTAAPPWVHPAKSTLNRRYTS